jgi:Phosphotransferase system cellobiose-specific component IIB
MNRVLVCCNTGVTTSLLVAKIKAVAEARGLEIEIEASPISTAADHISDADAVLLGPQVGFAKEAFEEAGAKKRSRYHHRGLRHAECRKYPRQY